MPGETILHDTQIVYCATYHLLFSAASKAPDCLKTHWCKLKVKAGYAKSKQSEQQKSLKCKAWSKCNRTECATSQKESDSFEEEYQSSHDDNSDSLLEEESSEGEEACKIEVM